MAEQLENNASTAPRVSRWSPQRLLAGRFLIVSIVVHLLFGIGATLYVVQRMQAQRKVTFQGGPGKTNAPTRALEHQVSVAKRKSMMGAPAQAKRITTSGLAKVAVPDMPTMPNAADVLPNRMAGMGGVGFGPGLGGSGAMGGGAGSGAGINFFGLRARPKTVVFVVDVSGSMVSGTKDAKS